jgi:hypothetical protein
LCATPPASYIARVEKSSQVTFHHVLVPLARIWFDRSYGLPDVQTTVAIKLP